MDIAYGKRKYVPLKCPHCGTKYEVAEPTSLSQILQMVYGYNIVLRKCRKWRIPRWYGVCGNCKLQAALYSGGYLLERIRRW